MAYGLELKGNKISLKMFCVESGIGYEGDSIAFIEDMLSIDDARLLKKDLTHYIKMLDGRFCEVLGGWDGMKIFGG